MIWFYKTTWTPQAAHNGFTSQSTTEKTPTSWPNSTLSTWYVSLLSELSIRQLPSTTKAWNPWSCLVSVVRGGNVKGNIFTMKRIVLPEKGLRISFIAPCHLVMILLRRMIRWSLRMQYLIRIRGWCSSLRRLKLRRKYVFIYEKVRNQAFRSDPTQKDYPAHKVRVIRPTIAKESHNFHGKTAPRISPRIVCHLRNSPQLHEIVHINRFPFMEIQRLHHPNDQRWRSSLGELPMQCYGVWPES